MARFLMAGHLGGYVPGGDPATFYPRLWKWLVDFYGVRSVLDIGCGDGVAVRFFAGLSQHMHVVGVDGVPQDNDRIVCHDYTTGPSPVEELFDLVWCCEFVEHVEERFVPHFVPDFQLGEMVLLTHADPGQDGHHHVNCQPSDYWRGVLAGAGYELDQRLTAVTRELAAFNDSPHNHYLRSGLAFVRHRA